MICLSSIVIVQISFVIVVGQITYFAHFHKNVSNYLNQNNNKWQLYKIITKNNNLQFCLFIENNENSDKNAVTQQGMSSTSLNSVVGFLFQVVVLGRFICPVFNQTSHTISSHEDSVQRSVFVPLNHYFNDVHSQRLKSTIITRELIKKMHLNVCHNIWLDAPVRQERPDAVSDQRFPFLHRLACLTAISFYYAILHSMNINNWKTTTTEQTISKIHSI